MKIHILGACGTFMGGLAALARAEGHEVVGSDRGVYPPMSDQLRELGITLREGYEPSHIDEDTDLVIIGNALSRGNAAVEHVLNSGLPYMSGPQWLGEHFLNSRTVLAVAGTHGKTTTTSLLAWILESSGYEPGFLIGGVTGNFDVSARAGGGEYFVIEADEYDTAFFDKRSKFIHYRPRVTVLNNLEFDHADIFDSLADIQRQFHHLVRTLPGNGAIILNADEPNFEPVLEQGCWTPVTRFSLDDEADWSGRMENESGTRISIQGPGGEKETIDWDMAGRYNLSNAVAACAAASHVGIALRDSAAALTSFRGIKRRQEVLTRNDSVTAIDDFAHHPTAVELTLDALRRRYAGRRLLAVFEPRSNSMRMGAHARALRAALEDADAARVLVPADVDWDVQAAVGPSVAVHDDADALLKTLTQSVREGDVVAFMSNGGFAGLPHRFARWADQTFD